MHAILKEAIGAAVASFVSDALWPTSIGATPVIATASWEPAAFGRAVCRPCPLPGEVR